VLIAAFAMAARVKTWDDAARLLLGGIGTSAAVRWYSGDLKQHKSARIRRCPASPHDLEIVVCQQRSRRESGRGSSKGVFGQASAGWSWLKKQAGKSPHHSGNNSQERGVHSENSRASSGSSSQMPHPTASVATSEGRGGGSAGGHRRTTDMGGIVRSHEAGRATVGAIEQSGTADTGLPPSPLTHNALAMWTDSWQEGGEGGEEMSQQRIKGYLRHAADLARQHCAHSPDRAVSSQCASLAPDEAGGGISGGGASSASSVGAGGGGSSSDGDALAYASDDAASDAAGWKKKVKKAARRVVKEVSVVMGADKAEGPQLSRSTLHGKTAGVGVQLARGQEGTVVVADVAPWIWAGKHGLAFPLSVGDVVTHVDDKKLAKGVSEEEAHRLLQGEQGTWVTLQLAGPSLGQVDMVMMDINGCTETSKEKRYLAGHRHRYTIQLMRLHPPAGPASVARSPGAAPALLPARQDGQVSGRASAGHEGMASLPAGFERLAPAGSLGANGHGHDAARATVLLENAVAGMHHATARMSGKSDCPSALSVGVESSKHTAVGGKERGLEALRERAREKDLLEERSGQMGVKGRRRRERTGLMAGLKMKGGLLRKMGALCSSAGACGAVDDTDVRVRDWVWNEEDEEEFLRDENFESKGSPRKGAVARFLKRATTDRGRTGGSDGGAVQREMSVKAIKSRGSVFRQESDGIGEMSFAGFPAEGGGQVEVSDYSEEDDSEDEEELARAIADFPAERPHEIDLRVGQVVVVLTRHESGWWEGCLASGEGRTGWFPSNHVQILPRAPRAKRKKEPSASAPVVVGTSAAEDPASFMPGLDYREASWADDAHDKRLNADNIDYKEASWAAFPRPAMADDMDSLGAHQVPCPADQYSEDSDNTYDEESKDGEDIDKGGREGEIGWLQQDLFLQTEASSDSLPVPVGSLRGSARGVGWGTELTAVEEGEANGVWRYCPRFVSLVCLVSKSVTLHLSNRVQVSDVSGNVDSSPDDLANEDAKGKGCSETGKATESGFVGLSGGSLREFSRSSMASISSAQSVRSGSVEDEDVKEDETILHEWGQGRLYEWMVSIDLELYAEALQIRSINGNFETW